MGDDFKSNDAFRAQETSMNSFRATEERLFEHFTGIGYTGPVAESIAHAFTQYMLGYVTAEGAAQSILRAGADEATARDLGKLFQDIKSEAATAPQPAYEAAH